MKRSLLRSIGALLALGLVVVFVVYVVFLLPFHTQPPMPPEQEPTPTVAAGSALPSCTPNLQGEVGIGIVPGATPCTPPGGR